jgi:hypothetical protein
MHGLGDRGHFGGLYNSGSIFGGQVSLICLIILILYMKNRSRIYIILFILFLILLVLSNHRTGILALIICGFFAFFSMNGSLRHRLTLAVMSVFALVVALPYLISMLFFDNLISFNSLNSSGRFSVWPYLINEWFYEWRTVIFGGGGGLAQHILITEFDGINAGIVLPHNEFIRLGVDYGLVGIVLCFGLILRTLSRYIEFSNLIVLHFIIESLFSNVLFWQISYLLPMFIFLRKPIQSNGDRL